MNCEEQRWDCRHLESGSDMTRDLQPPRVQAELRRKSRFGKACGYLVLPKSSTSPLGLPTNCTCRDPSRHHQTHLDCRDFGSLIYIDASTSIHVAVTAAKAFPPALRERILSRMATPRPLVAFIATGPVCHFPMASQLGHLLHCITHTITGL